MRQNRYNKLIDSGFAPWEATPLSTISLTVVPYMKDLIRMRGQLFQQWFKSGELRSSYTRKELYSKIAEWYIQQGFVRPGTTKPDVWRYVRSIEDEFEYKYPDYVSPSRNKRHTFVSYKGR